MKNFKKKALSMALLLGLCATFTPMTAHASQIPTDIKIKASKSSVYISAVYQAEPGRYFFDGSGFENIGYLKICDSNGNNVNCRRDANVPDVFYNVYSEYECVGKVYVYDKSGNCVAVKDINLYPLD